LGIYLAQGLKNQKHAISIASAELVTVMDKSMRNRGEIKSPSRLTERIAKFFGAGLVNGLLESSDSVEKASFNLGDKVREGVSTAVNAVKDLINGTGTEIDWTITPQVNLSKLKAGLSDASNMMSQQLGSITSLTDPSSLSSLGIDSEALNDATGKGYTFIQNNYSPKALSNTEIYRQTNNLITSVKGALNTP